jgi:hypothetical protein
MNQKTTWSSKRRADRATLSGDFWTTAKSWLTGQPRQREAIPIVSDGNKRAGLKRRKY